MLQVTAMIRRRLNNKIIKTPKKKKFKPTLYDFFTGKKNLKKKEKKSLFKL